MALGSAFGKLRKKTMKLEKEAFSHKQDNKALLKGEAFYRDILEGQTELICRFHPDGAITYVNDAYCRYFGKTLEELIGHSFMPFIPIKDRDKLEKHFSSLTEKNPVGSIEHRVVLPSGEVRWQQWINRAIFDVQGRRVEFQSVGRDLTERMEIEAALRESENNFRALAENAHDGILIAVSEDSYIYGNKRAKEISGYSSSELFKGGFKKLIHPDELPKVREIFQRRMAGKQVPGRYETKIVQKGGKVVPIEVSGSKTIWHGQHVIMAIIRDIAARKQIEAELTEAHDELEQRVEARTLELMEAAAELESKHKELLHHKKELEKVNRELVDTNKALSVLARNIDRKREEAEKKISMAISSKIIPVIEGLKNDKTLKSLEA